MCNVTVTDGKAILPITALNAATANGAGSSTDLSGVSNEFTMHVVVTGSPSSFQVALEGSLNGSNWYSMASVNESNGTNSTTGTVVGNGLDSGGTTPIKQLQRHARYVRANLTNLSGGSSPTVMALVAVGRII